MEPKNFGLPDSPHFQFTAILREYMSIGVRTAQRYEALYRMPVHRPAVKDRSALLALSDGLDLSLNNTPKQTSTEAAAASVDATAQHQTGKPTYPSSRN